MFLLKHYNSKCERAVKKITWYTTISQQSSYYSYYSYNNTSNKNHHVRLAE